MGGIVTRGQIYKGAPIGVVQIRFQLEIAALVKVPPGSDFLTFSYWLSKF